MTVKIEETAYGGWSHCYKISNGIVELIITAEVGPRLMRFAFVDGENQFCEVPETLGRTDDDEWHLYGGHRFWHAPEAQPRTYYPDNHPVIIEQQSSVLKVIQPTEPTTGITKELDIAMSPDGASVKVTHRMMNRGLWAVRLAPWALSVMAAGGTAIVPLPPRGSHEENLLPVNTLTLWAYTNLSDSRWTLGEKYVLLRQVPGAATPQKIGISVDNGWAAYVNNGHLFLKQFQRMNGAEYPDFGSNVEVFTNDFMLELETLGPLVCLEPNTATDHVETWSLHADIPTPGSDADVDKHIKPLVK